jgi:hypothetical protein
MKAYKFSVAALKVLGVRMRPPWPHLRTTVLDSVAVDLTMSPARLCRVKDSIIMLCVCEEWLPAAPNSIAEDSRMKQGPSIEVI